MNSVDPAVVFSFGERAMEAFQFYRMQIAASTMIGAALGMLGAFVVLRRMALIGDALSHAILPGVVLAFMLMDFIFGHMEGLWGVWGLFAGALLAGLVTALSIGWLSRHARAKDDSVIGIVFTAMFGLGVVLISLQPKGTHFDLTCFLFGLPLAIKLQDFVSIAIITPAVIAFIAVAYRGLKILSFDPQMALASGVRVNLLHYAFMGFLAATVVSALRTVGVIMSVAMLITPAATAYQLTNRLSTMLWLSGLFGALSAAVGFVVAFVLNIPTGPAMVLFATALFGIALVLSPKYGLVHRALRRRTLRRHIAEEDVLKVLAREERALNRDELRGFIPQAQPKDLSFAVSNLFARKLLRRDSGTYALTKEGLARGMMLVRSHRLWETYLADGSVPLDGIHDGAERLEHAHNLAEQLYQELGKPRVDPHGEDIPRRTPRENAGDGQH
ncbi:MAG: metal ABC transporter permease [Deltaproteobacteria bacterium]|nr:metal ABC transporter permease [Deltaproteobacteria bacterium]